MTTTFYAPPSMIRAATYVVLPDEEAAHAVRVLRKRPGDEIVVVDGEGGWYRVRLEQADKRGAGGTILESQCDVGEPGYDLSIGVALLKNRNRFETFLEKAVELGVREVIPLLTDRTERTHFKAERAEKISVAAMKQCGRSRLMHIAAPQPLGVLFQQPYADLTLIAHEQTAPEHHLAIVLTENPFARTISILIGPEGGFSEAEVAVSHKAGYTPVSLGPRRLRAETAAIVAATSVMITRRP